MEFYKILRTIMDERGMSIPDVARAAGLSDSTVRSIVNRRSKTVALEVAAKLSRGLGVSLEQLNDGLSRAVSSDLLSGEEYQLVQKYRALDGAAKARIQNSLDFEYRSLAADGEKSSAFPA